jgi:hypothetical protein
VPKLFDSRVSVETDRPEFPSACVCCLKPASGTYRPTPPGGVAATVDPERMLTIPYCARCLAHVSASQWVGTWNLIALNVGAWGALPFIGAFGLAGALATSCAAGVLIALVARWRIQSQPLQAVCSHKDVAMRSLWMRRSTYIFSFANAEYASRFEGANTESLTPPDSAQA